MADIDSIVEEWRIVQSAPDYEVSNLGVVRRARDGHARKAGQAIKHTVTRWGYVSVTLCTAGKVKVHFVHRLVVEAFIGPAPSSRHRCAHRDGHRAKNVLSNLSWKTFEENEADKVIHGTHLEGERVATAKLSEDEIRVILATKKTSGSGRRLAERFGVTPTHISRIRLGKAWTHLDRNDA